MNDVLCIPCSPEVFTDLVAKSVTDAVQEKYGYDLSVVSTGSRNRRLAFARSAAATAMHLFGYSGHAIGGALNINRNAVRYAINKVTNKTGNSTAVLAAATAIHGEVLNSLTVPQKGDAQS